MMIIQDVGLDQIFIDLDTDSAYWTVMINGQRIGMYSVFGTLTYSWENTLRDYLDEKLGIV